MQHRARFSFTQRMSSFRHAFRGLHFLLLEQHNARIHLAASIGVVVMASFVGVSRSEWCLLVLAIAGVWGAEALNSAVEVACDAITTEAHPLIGKAKDLAACGVLSTALGAATIGALVLGPPLLHLFR